MENNHELIVRIENSVEFLSLIKKGLLPLSILDKKVYYEYFLSDFKKTKLKSESIRNTSEEYDVCEMTIKRAIKFMEE